MTEYAESDICGRTPRILSSGDHDDAYYDRLWTTTLQGDTWREEIVNRRRNSDRYHANQTIEPIEAADGTITEFVAIQIDITGRNQRERQLQVFDRILRHNLRNDMSVVLGHAENIEAASDGELANYAALIRRKGESLLEMADKERAIVRLITDHPHPRPIDVTAAVRTAVSDATKQWPTASISVTAPDQVCVAAIADLDGAIAEVLENAIVHCDRTLTIEVVVETTDESAIVRIADNGPGIPDQDRSVLRSHSDIDSLYHGSGIGLWYVSWVLTLSAGRLSFEANEPRGSVVVLELDRTATPSAS
ncbi:MAG: PAS domain-containing sensor histidine kinase [Halobacteriota archaeon]